MDLFSYAITDLPGPNDPGYKGIESSIANRARRFIGYADFSYSMATAAYKLSGDMIVKEYRETGRPVPNDRQYHLTGLAIVEVYKYWNN